MRADVLYAGLVTAAASAVPSGPPDGPVVWNLYGTLVPVVPSLIGVLAALLVRIVVITSPGRKPRTLSAYNVSLTLLTMLGAVTWITDHQLGPGQAFITGVACGAMGVSLIELARSQFALAFKAGAQAMFTTMFKSKSEGDGS